MREHRKGRPVPKCDNPGREMDVVVPISQLSDTASDDGAAPPAKPACVALVPSSPTAPPDGGPWWRWSPEASFVAQLMACARERRRVRRASPADAESAYRMRQISANPAGGLTRQVV